MDLFGNTIETKKSIDRFELEKMLSTTLKNMSLEDFVFIITNKFTEIIEYAELTNGAKTCQKTSLLFNSHRLTTNSISSKLSIFEALKTDSFISGLSRALLFKKGKVKELLYQVIQLGINGVQYINEFPPHIARDIYKSNGLNKNSKILDPCAGWGGRMIGASVISDNYFGFDPSIKTYNGLVLLNDFIKTMNPDFSSVLNKTPFEDSELQNNFYDFALTSPPYYNTENYSDEKNNSQNRYKNFDEWCNYFYLPLIEKTMCSLKRNSTFVLNIGSRKYPLNEVLLSNFNDSYIITKGKNKLSGKSGLKNNKKEGEIFYHIRKK